MSAMCTGDNSCSEAVLSASEHLRDKTGPDFQLRSVDRLFDDNLHIEQSTMIQVNKCRIDH